MEYGTAPVFLIQPNLGQKLPCQGCVWISKSQCLSVVDNRLHRTVKKQRRIGDLPSTYSMHLHITFDDIGYLWCRRSIDIPVPGGDAPDPEVSIKRRRISFIGGVDLTTGRYDTPDHGLYRTLNTAHQGDFRNKLGGVCSGVLRSHQSFHFALVIKKCK